MHAQISRGVLAIVLCGCSSPLTIGRQSDSNPDLSMPGTLDGLSSIEVTPGSAQVVVTNGTSPATDFVATGHYQDGHTADITGLVIWSIDDATLGLVASGHYSATVDQNGSPIDHGGSTKLTVTASGLSGSATVDILYQIVRVSSDQGSTAPANAPDLFASATADASLAPQVVYPIDQTLVPSNLNSIEIQWASSGAGFLYEVTVAHPSFSVKSYTNATVSGGGRYLLTTTEWNALAKTVQDSSVMITVRALAPSSGKVGTSTSVKLAVAKDPLQGGIYYWANQGNGNPPYSLSSGIIRRDFGDPNAKSQEFYTDAQANSDFGDNAGGNNHCPGCHAVSRDGKKFAVTYDAFGLTAGLFDVATLMPTLPVKQVDWYFASFSPDGNRMVKRTPGSPAQLDILDVSGGIMTGMTLSSINTTTLGQPTQPNWSPDGTKIVFAVGSLSDPGEVNAASIAVASDTGGGVFGNLKTVVAAQGDNNYYPSFSPDSKWILFNKAASGSSYNNSGADIWVVSADGSTAPVRLTLANSGSNVTNSWPQWTPFVSKFGSDTLYYFTVASKRDYGLELHGVGRSQIWISSFMPSQLTPSGAGSSAPFWMPVQDPTTSNHDAQWVEAIVPEIN